MDFTPYEDEFKTWRSRITNAQYDQIFEELDSRVSGDEIHTSSWIPGADWTNTVFDPIYSIACRNDEEASARFFGQILW